MKRTRKMILMTVVATVAIAFSLMSTAFAAPSTCPLKAKAAPAATQTCPRAALANKLLGANVNPTDVATDKCPSADALKQMLGKLDINCAGGSCTGGNCPTCTTGTCVSGNCQSTCANGACTNGTCTNGSCATGGSTANTGSTCPSKALLQSLLGGNTNLSSLLSASSKS